MTPPPTCPAGLPRGRPVPAFVRLDAFAAARCKRCKLQWSFPVLRHLPARLPLITAAHFSGPSPPSKRARAAPAGHAMHASRFSARVSRATTWVRAQARPLIVIT